MNIEIDKPGSILYYFILPGLWLSFLISQYLMYRQYKVCKQTSSVPDVLIGLYDDDTFNKARLYQIDCCTLGFWMSFYYAAIITTILLYGIPVLWSTSVSLVQELGCTHDCMITQFLTLCILGKTFYTIVVLPWVAVETFVIEQRHGFNRQTPSFFIKDQLKQYIIWLASVLPCVTVLLYIAKRSGDYYFIFAWLFIVVISLLFNIIVPGYITPFFDKHTNLPEGELSYKIEELAASVNFPSHKIYIAEVSKRSSHANAYFCGISSNMRIVLFDTLLENYHSEKEGKEEFEATEKSFPTSQFNWRKGYNGDEIVAILSHELGHWKYNHVFKTLLISWIQLLLAFVIMQFFLPETFLFHDVNIVVNSKPITNWLFPAFMCTFTSMRNFSFKFEVQADNFAKSLGQAEALKSALIKLDMHNLVFPVCDRWYAEFVLSHAPLLKRLKSLDETEENLIKECVEESVV